MEANVAEECEDTPVFIIGAGPALQQARYKQLEAPTRLPQASHCG